MYLHNETNKQVIKKDENVKKIKDETEKREKFVDWILVEDSWHSYLGKFERFGSIVYYL